MSAKAREVIEQLLEHVETQHADVIGAIQDALLYLLPCHHGPEKDGECENENEHHGRPPAPARAVPKPYTRAVEVLRAWDEMSLVIESAMEVRSRNHYERVIAGIHNTRAALAAVDAQEKARG